MTATAFAPSMPQPDPLLPAPAPRLRVVTAESLRDGNRGTVGGELATVVEHPSAVRAAATHADRELFRRRRFFAALAITIAVLAIVWQTGLSLTSFPAAATAPADSLQTPAVHTVVPGDTYGAIASALGVDSPASFAEQLRVANGGGDLVVGQRLVIDLSAIAQRNR